MPSRVTSSAIPPALSSPTPTTSTSTPTITTTSSPPTDIVDISVKGDSSSGSDITSTPIYKDYSAFKEQFRFDIENGRFGPQGRYSPLKMRFQSIAISTYQARANIAGQVAAFAGRNSAQSALFSLGYQDASPNPTGASGHVNARAAQNRRIDRNLDLLNML